MAVFCYRALSQVVAEKSLTEKKIHWRERKIKSNKGTDKQNVAVFFVTQYNSSLPSFVPNFRALSQVVAEKFLTKKKFIGEKRK